MPDPVIVVRQPQRVAVVTTPGLQGIPGPPGEPGTPGDAAEQNVFIQNDAPVAHPDTYLWVQTGLGDDRDTFTIWLEDGA